jgi:hypothetical protein
MRKSGSASRFVAVQTVKAARQAGGEKPANLVPRPAVAAA